MIPFQDSMPDSNILLDVLTVDRQWFSWSAAALDAAANRGRVVINPVIYAELSAGFERIEDLDAEVPLEYIEREQLPSEAAFLAGHAFRDYRRRGGGSRAPLADFFIGAHALVAGYTLITRDAARYRTYFPRLLLIAP